MRMRALLVSVAVLVLVAAVTSTPAQAQFREGCRDRIERAEEHLRKMLHRFGPHNDAVRDARFDLERIRDVCFRRDYGRHDGGGGHEWRGRAESDHTWHGDRRGPHQ